MEEVSATNVRIAVSANPVRGPAPRAETGPAPQSRPVVKASAADMESAAQQLQDLASQHKVNLNFSVHQRTGRTLIRVVNSQTKEVVREIPPEEVLDLMATMEEIAGKLVSTRA